MISLYRSSYGKRILWCQLKIGANISVKKAWHAFLTEALRIRIITSQRLARIAPSFLFYHHCSPAIQKFQSSDQVERRSNPRTWACGLFFIKYFLQCVCMRVFWNPCNTTLICIKCIAQTIQCMECGLGYGLSAKYISNKYCVTPHAWRHTNLVVGVHCSSSSFLWSHSTYSPVWYIHRPCIQECCSLWVFARMLLLAFYIQKMWLT